MNFVKLATLLGIASTAAGHGFLASINADGKNYPGFNPDGPGGSSAELIAWSTTATDQGFVKDVHSPNIICHSDAEPGALSAEVAAGGTVTVTWSSWPADHHGPVIDYLANCNGDCSTVDKTTLKFFKVDQDGLTGDDTWASDKLVAQGGSWDITIPTDLKAGNYVLRHEIIALHSAGSPQPYPQCVNLKVTGGGTLEPAGTLGMELYSGNEEGLTVNIWNKPKNYKYVTPGPRLYNAGDSGSAAAVQPSAATASEASGTTSAQSPSTTLSTTTSPSSASAPSASSSSTKPSSPTACPASTNTSSPSLTTSTRTASSNTTTGSAGSTGTPSTVTTTVSVSVTITKTETLIQTLSPTS
ncbi:glycosyl hydrolase family 61-domain-containing protein [Aspergillus varians]